MADQKKVVNDLSYTAPFSVTLNDLYPKFQGHAILSEYLINNRRDSRRLFIRYSASKNGVMRHVEILIGTYRRPTQQCHFTDAWVSLAPLWLNLTKSGVSKDSVSPPSSEYTPLLCSR